MGKILLRIYPNEFGAKITTLIDKTLDIVLHDGSVIHGKLTSFQKEELSITNNHYRRKHQIMIAQIAEIIIDQEKSC